jgi:aminoglycoside 3-N-acetyltransferase I
MRPNTKTFAIKHLSKEDLSTFNRLITLFNLVFEEMEPAIATEASLLKLLNNNNFIVLAAMSGHEVVGGLTAYVLPMYYSDHSEVFLYDLAVNSQYQRMGIGKTLIHGLKEYCIKNGIKEFFVLAHEEDEHAVEFYRSTGGKSEKVINFLYETAVVKD